MFEIFIVLFGLGYILVAILLVYIERQDNKIKEMEEELEE